jgi:dTDP-glucose pyrophosphorylase
MKKDTLNILLPLAGPSIFFNKEEFVFPKPLIEINGKTMIQHVIENLNRIRAKKKFIFVVNAEDCKKYHLDNVLKLLTDNSCKIVYVQNATKGAVCSALLAIEEIDADTPLVIANPDQIIDENLENILEYFQDHQCDSGVISFNTVHPRWSYIRLDTQDRIIEAAEKRPISKHAIAGFYYFAKGKHFVKSAMDLIEKASHVNGLYYISMTLNELILDGKKLMAYHLDTHKYHTFYSPQKIEEYQKLAVQNHSKGYFVHNQVKGKISVVVPMAGNGSRFTKAGYTKPKPFINVDGKPMIARVLDNLNITNAEYILIALQEHLSQDPETMQWLEENYPVKFLPINQMTEGTACTLLHARHLIDNDRPLMIANCDQIVDVSLQDFLDDCFKRGLDGSILTFVDHKKDPKWSFAKVDQNNIVVEVKEKKPISDLATVGIYIYRHGKDFVDSATDMIARNDRVNNEFYACPVYNYAIKQGKKIGIYTIDSSQMHGIGTPEDLNAYLQK